jgi:bifunctional non-homologous end joining protein LigD
VWGFFSARDHSSSRDAQLAKPPRRPRLIQRAAYQQPATVQGGAVIPASRRSKQPELFDDPPPPFVEPCLATLKAGVPVGDKWLHEIKWDGYRLTIRIENGEVKLLTRRGHDWTDRFPTIRDAARALPVRSAIIDGEAVVEINGISNFSALQAALGAREGPGHKAAIEAVFYAFDLLHLNGVDLMPAPLTQRKDGLAELVGGSTGPIRYSEHLPAREGDALFRQACRMGLEGIISKRADRPYRSGRGDDWLKIKCTLRQEFVVAGYLPLSTGGKAIGALVLGFYDGLVLTYAGRVGTGFTHKTAHDLSERLQPLRTDKQPFPQKLPSLAKKGVEWVEPELVAEVEYRGWTSDRQLRHASYKGLREDKDPREVVNESAPERATEPEAPRRGKAPQVRKVVRFRPENIQTLYRDAVVPSDDQLTAYWQAVGNDALKYLGRRPLKLVRHVRGKTFMHQGPFPPVPDTVHQLRIEKATGEEGVRLWVDSVDGLLGLLAIDVVEIHPWGATVDDVDHPDMLVIDIDPGPSVEWEIVTETALKLRDVFKSEGISSWAKVSGSKGIHVMAPVEPDLDWDRARAYCKALAERVAATNTRRYTMSARQARTGRIFLDYLRNVPSITAIGTYSPRAKPGFPVAMRVTWTDVENGIGPDAFTMESLREKRRPSRR